jgi:sarcosine oxidase subunit delta
MLRINCPYCGERAEVEFRCGGQAHIERPGAGGEQVSDEDWAAYLFFRQNPKGEHRERWLHAAGCRRWFNLARHTITHEILAVYPMGERRPSSSESSGA